MKELNQPTSIRWNKDKMDFVREKENLDTAQKVVSFLLDKYYWENRSGISALATETTNIKESAKEISPPPVIISAMQEYLQEINSAGGIKSIQYTVEESVKDNRLNAKEKEQIKLYGIQKSKGLDV